jgi:hypothetical protein
MKTGSLIQQSEAEHTAQPSLFELGEAATAPLKANGCYTGELLWQTDPAKYKAVAGALGEGMGVRQIARAYHVHTMTVRAIREREFPVIANEKATTAKLLRKFARIGAERLLEEVDDIHIDKLPLALAIATDKAQLLDGEATVRMETVKSFDPAQWEELISRLPEVPVDGTVIDIPAELPGTGCVGKEDGAKGPGSGEPCSNSVQDLNSGL